MNLSKETFSSIIDIALTEDTAQGDVTSEALIPQNYEARHRYSSKPEESLPEDR